jgi:hypothetical protein
VKIRRKARSDWLALMPNAHEGYVSWEKAEAIRKMVSSNVPTSRHHGAPKHGDALLAGLLRCRRRPGQPIGDWRTGGAMLVASPALDDDLGLAQGIEDPAVEQLIAKAGVEALDVAVLPRAAPLNVSGLGTDNRDPFLHGLGENSGPLSERM